MTFEQETQGVIVAVTILPAAFTCAEFTHSVQAVGPASRPEFHTELTMWYTLQINAHLL